MLPQRRGLALWVWYQGERFRGFQTQVKGPTVQEELARALATLGIQAAPSPAGRTDRGVHARMQVVTVRSEAAPPERVLEELPPLLPAGLGLCAVERPLRAFHAQWSCAGKEYRYRLRLSAAAAPAWATYSWLAPEHPRLAGRAPAPERVAQLLARAVGTRDFIAFHGKSSPRKPRTLERAELVEREQGLFEVRLAGNAFARYQVRYLVGSAVATAAGVIPEEKFIAALEAGETIEGVRAPPEGLVLWEVHYPPELDPFGPDARAAPQGLPEGPPFA
jgi:tRNA pseudouridine38-40 synthase